MPTTRIGSRLDPEVPWDDEHRVSPEAEPVSRRDGLPPLYVGGVLVDFRPGDHTVPIIAYDRRDATTLMFRLAHSLGLNIEIRPRAFYPAPLVGRR